MSEVYGQEYRNTHIARQETGYGPPTREIYIEAIDEDQNYKAHNGNPRPVRLHNRLIW